MRDANFSGPTRAAASSALLVGIILTALTQSVLVLFIVVIGLYLTWRFGGTLTTSSVPVADWYLGEAPHDTELRKLWSTGRFRLRSTGVHLHVLKEEDAPLGGDPRSDEELAGAVVSRSSAIREQSRHSPLRALTIIVISIVSVNAATIFVGPISLAPLVQVTERGQHQSIGYLFDPQQARALLVDRKMTGARFVTSTQIISVELCEPVDAWLLQSFTELIAKPGGVKCQ
jgi:hypothetical protein